ncbi:hypothetical protein [Halomonas sp. PR-M31]|uniref:hypothetical protein n=1 Tax=Halomonas sp. PR-M31 TaxID=1471202 RepID=UPI000651882F|nr:hypothetical protein [Halomonas sp. PR-M31]
MTSERSQIHYTCIFLYVSFQAIQEAVEKSCRGEDTPCWLDARTLRMLLGELQQCRQNASPFPIVCESLDTAIYHCGLLMAQCPAAVNRRLCGHHLEAIILPLKAAAAQLSGKVGHVAGQDSVLSFRGLRSWLGW